MKNRKFAKVALIALAMVLVCIVSVVGTVAYLTSKSAVVTNTFTVGNVTITLDEADVDEAGEVIENADRVTENTYKLIPGETYTKDPTVHVAAGSESSWLFVKVENGIEAIEASETVAEQMAADWTLVAGTENIYAYKTTVQGGDDIVVFENFTIKGDVDNDTLASYNDKTIVVQALAVQSTGFDSAADAFTAVGGWPA